MADEVRYRLAGEKGTRVQLSVSRRGGDSTAWLLAPRQNQSARHPLILLTCGHINAWCTHTRRRSSHEPPPSIHMSVSEPVGQNQCFLPGTEGSQAGVYLCVCAYACVSTVMRWVVVEHWMSVFVTRREGDHFSRATNAHIVFSLHPGGKTLVTKRQGCPTVCIRMLLLYLMCRAWPQLSRWH